MQSVGVTGREAGEAGPNAIFDILSSGQFTDQVEGTWEMDLMMDQATPWKIQQGVSVPKDPEVSASTNHQRLAARSTSSEALNNELESTIASLDPTSLSYLKTLLALPEPECIQNYLSQNRYTSDIYGLPQIEKLFELAASGEEEGSTVEEGRVRAVRRLGMVMLHLWGEEFLNEQNGNTGVIGTVEGARRMERVRSTGNSEWDEDNAARSSSTSLINGDGNAKGKGKAPPSQLSSSELDTSQYLAFPTASSHRSASPSHNSHFGPATNGGLLERGELAGHTDGSRSGKSKEGVPIPFQIL